MGTRGSTWGRVFSLPAGQLITLAFLSALIGACNSGSDASTQQSSTPTSTLTIQQRLEIESNPLGDGGGDAAPASPSIGAFAVYATEALEMNGGSSIVGGAAGIEGTTGPFLGGGAAAYFNSGATIQSSQTLYASSVYLNSGVSLGPVDTNHILGNGGATYGPVASFPAMPAAPTMPSATAGSTNVTLNSGASRTLAAGAYGSVTVNGSATLTLSGGAYTFSSLTLNSNGTLAVAAASTLSVTGGANFGSGAYAGPASGSGLTAKAFVLYVDTTNGINLNSNATIDALMVATNAEVTVNTSAFTGALAARQVLMNSGGKVTFQDGFGALGVGDAGAPNLCAGVTCSASDQCHVPGTCNPSTGVCSNPTATNGTTCNDNNACSQTDTCQAGVCTGSNPVVCLASDQCHVAGTCDPSSGVCSNPTAANGTACTDGNACTQVDACESGVCVGSDPVVCGASDQCHAAGTCNPSNGVCSNPTAPNGTSCSDGNACTQSDACNNGTCVGSNPVVCTSAGQCSLAGTCNPSTGVCSNPNAPNGTACSDGNACTQSDACVNGTCVGSNPIVCTSAGQCSQAGTCDPTTGVCSSPNAPNGTACSDGNACTQSDACENGTCVGSNPVTCPAPDQCHTAGTCQPSSGTCTNPVASNGTACNSGNACFTGDTCQNGTCTNGPPVTCVAEDSCHLAGTCSAGDGGTGGCSNPVAPAGTSCAVGACGGSCNATGVCVEAVAATNACFSSTCSPDGGVVPGPSSCVPTLNGTVATNIASMVAGGPVAAAQAALIRGRVLGLPEGAPLAGVTVSILGHPEYNPSITGPDGTYAVAVNGGAQVIVSYAGPVGGETTYLPVQRHTPTRWQDYAAIPDVYLTPLDPNATDITLGSGTWQAAAGSTITDPADQNGVPGGPPVSPTLPHTARVFFPADTTANFIYGGCGNTAGSCGATCSQGTCTAGECTGVATPALTVRLTEYTVGATGKAAMPAELPPSTAYTYALELSADEAIAKGATGVSFNQPVVLYVDDFLGFGAAQSSIVNPPVPVAFYNRATGEWVPSSNGQIIEISGFTGTCPGTGCVASLRSGATDGGAPLSLSSDELAFLGQTYGSRTAPVYLWRVPTNHFTGGDLNWPFTPPDGPSPPPDPDCPDCPDIPNTCDQLSGGSIIECENAILAQQITIPGTPFFLRYQSERAPGRVPTISIQLTDASWPPTAPEVMPLNVTVEIDLAGNTYTMSYPPSSLTPSQFVQWTWDQKDAFGNTIEGQQLATVTVSYIYAGVYTGVPSDTPITFNSVSSTGSIIGSVLVRALNQVARTTVAQVWIGVEDAAPLGLGGWTISPHHVYDPRSYSFWGGDGNRRFPHSPVIQSVPGVTGLQGIVPAVSPSGALYETQGVVLESVSSTGTLTPVAGAGTLLGSYPACTPALSAQFPTDIVSLATTPAGTIYVGDSTAVHLVDPIGNTIQTVAGQVLSNGNSVEGCQDATVGAQGTLGSPQGLAVSPDGSVYIADVGCNSLRRILPNGSLVTVSSSSASCEPVLSWNPGQLLSTACIGQPTAVAVAPDGTIYLAENAPFSRIDRIDAKTTVISTYAGIRSGPTGQSPTVNDGKAAIGVHFAGFIGGLTVGGDGTLYLTDPGGPALYSIDPMGIMHLIAGGAPAGAVTEVDNVPASETLIAIPMSLAIDSIGDVFMFDYGTSSNPARVREIVSPFPRYAGGTTVIPSTDGTELYQFSPLGQHLATLDPVTGATLRTFQYDGQNRLTSVTETRGGTTRLSYNGDTVTITPPFSAGGQQTVLTLDQAGGHTTAITTPAGETTQLAYSNGLMTSLIDPRLGVHSYAYDSLGRLTSDTDPANATTGVVVTNDFTPVSPDGGVLPGVSWSSAVTSPVGHVTTHQDLQLSNGTRERNIIAPSGATRLSSESSGELWTTVAPDGTTTLSQQTADPQFGMLDPYVSALTRTTPSGLTYKSTRNRTSTGSALAPSSITDLLTVNGQTEAWEQLFAAAAGPSAAHWLFTSPAGRQRLQTLDALGRVTSISFPGTRTLPTTTFVYDADGRVSSVTVTPNGGGVPRVTTNTYDTYLAGYLATSQDPAADVTTYDQRDQDGRVLDVELPDFSMQPLSHVGTTYDPNGNVTSVTVPPATSLPSTHSFTNTPVDLLESYTPPQVSSTTTGNDPELATLTTSYTYNGDRQLTKESVPEGTGFQTVMTDYDGFGRLSATYDPLSNVTASYQYVLNAAGVSTDQVGSVVTSDGVSLTNTYDGFLKTRASWASSSVNGSVSWTYDTFFRPSTLQVSGAAPVAFSYDLDSLYVGTSSPSFGVTRDQSGSSLDGLPYSSVLGTVSDAWTYDGFGAQSSYTVKTSDGTVLYAMYGSGGIGSPITRDSLGRITLMNETINGATHSWLMTYDSRSRLESVTLDGGTNVYTYDPNGNLTEINGATFGTYDAQDRMVTLNPANGSGPWTYSYTNNGDLTEKTSGTQEYAFDYDLSSNLRSAQVNTSITADVSYVIDGSNRRVGKAITPSIGASVADGLLYDEQNRVVGELGASGSVLSTFVYGLKPNVPDYMVNGGTTYRIISDWRGDVRLVLNTTETGTAAVVQRLDYDAWGNVTNLVDPDCSVGGTALCWQPFGFGGGLWEPATGIVRFGARDYDPMAGRFVQKDPVRLAGGQNVFLYANDDPINGSDPSGEWPKWIPAPSVLKCDGWYVQCLNPPQPPSPTPPDSNPDMCMEVPAPNNNPNKDWCQYCFTVCVQRAGFWEATWPTDIPACKY